MPHLQFETTIDLDRTAKHDFADAVTELYANHMATGTGHVAVTIHTLADGFFSLGWLEPDADAAMLNADIREGREFEQQRAFVRAAFETAHEQWAIPTANMYAVVTEHSGKQFHEYDRVLSSWEANEADTGAD